MKKIFLMWMMVLSSILNAPMALAEREHELLLEKTLLVPGGAENTPELSRVPEGVGADIQEFVKYTTENAVPMEATPPMPFESSCLARLGSGTPENVVTFKRPLLSAMEEGTENIGNSLMRAGLAVHQALGVPVGNYFAKAMGLRPLYAPKSKALRQR